MRLVSVYQCAFNDLCMDCHLYKRRLNFEWTSAEESVEMLRKRTAENYGGMRRYEFSVVKQKNTRDFLGVFFHDQILGSILKVEKKLKSPKAIKVSEN